MLLQGNSEPPTATTPPTLDGERRNDGDHPTGKSQISNIGKVTEILLLIS